MKNTGTVIQIKDNLALVKVKRISACDACEGKVACEGSLVGECSKAAEVNVWTNNEIGAKVGERVEFSSPTAFTLGIAFAVFIIPIVAGFVAYFTAKSFAESETIAFVTCLVAFALFFVGLFFGIDRALKDKVRVTVTKIIDEKE